jgi:hypothetical protein
MSKRNSNLTEQEKRKLIEAFSLQIRPIFYLANLKRNLPV